MSDGEPAFSPAEFARVFRPQDPCRVFAQLAASELLMWAMDREAERIARVRAYVDALAIPDGDFSPYTRELFRELGKVVHDG